MRRGILVCWGAAMWACVTPPPVLPVVEPPPTPPVQVPEGCLVNLAGAYQHAEDAAFRYTAHDDGRHLEMTSLHLAQGRADAGSTRRDGGASAGRPMDGEGAPRLSLERTPKGFVGFTHATVVSPSGQVCEARFPTEVVACDDGGLAIRSSDQLSMSGACVPASQDSRVRQHRLVRRMFDAGF